MTEIISKKKKYLPI